MTTPLLINNAATLLLPPQTLNTHQKTSHRSHTTTKSTTTPLLTNHYPLNTPQNLSSPTTQTNWHHTYKPIISQHIVTSLTSHLHSKISTPTQKPPFTLITQLNHLLRSHQHIITLISHHKNLSPPNLQNTPKHNPSLTNPNLINYRTLSNTASPISHHKSSHHPTYKTYY